MAEAESHFAVIRQEATRPATVSEITRILAGRFAIYPQPDRSDGEWAAWWADYTNALDDIPPSAIEAGMAAYVKAADSEFFPKPGRIRELARTVPNPVARACDGLRREMERQARTRTYETEPPATSPAPPTESEKAKVGQMLAEFHKTMEARSAPAKPPLPSIAGRVDQAGVTAEMRAVLEGRR